MGFAAAVPGEWRCVPTHHGLAPGHGSKVCRVGMCYQGSLKYVV